MKKLAFASVCLLIAIGISCKEAKKEEKKVEIKVSSPTYSLVIDSSKVSFTAYKTTDKLPVGGTFTEINISENTDGATPLEALNGTKFSIPVSSLFTNDGTGTRDPKIKEFFFGVMKNTELISGAFKSTNNTTSVDVTLNGETQNIPLKYTITGDNITFEGVMQLENWNALDAIASLNKVCEALHAGKDGVSKTWSEVAIKAEVLVVKK